MNLKELSYEELRPLKDAVEKQLADPSQLTADSSQHHEAKALWYVWLELTRSINEEVSRRGRKIPRVQGLDVGDRFWREGDLFEIAALTSEGNHVVIALEQ